MKQYLKKLDLLPIVWLSEDGSGVQGKVEFDPNTNQMVGLVLPLDQCTGMPIKFSFLARDVDEIQENMKRNKSMYVYVIMAQPLSRDVPPFPLQLFGSDNKFTTKNVSLRWQYTVEQLKRLIQDIILLCTASIQLTYFVKSLGME